MAVAKLLLHFRLAECSCFRLDFIAGALLVIALLPSRATCSAFQSRSSSSHLHLPVHLHQSAGVNRNFDAAT